MLSRVPAMVPEPDDQRAIAHILGTLDDKIERNGRVNEMVEAMALVHFKSRFENFDPVRMKGAGISALALAKAGLSQPLADLLSDSCGNSELGKILKGRDVGRVGAIAKNPLRGVQPESIARNMSYIARTPRRCIALSDLGIADGLESEKFEFRKGDVFFGKLWAYFHEVDVAPVDGACSTYVVALALAPKDPSWFAFVLGNVSSVKFVEYTNDGSIGAAVHPASWNEMARYEIVLLPQTVAASFRAQLRCSVA